MKSPKGLYYSDDAWNTFNLDLSKAWVRRQQAFVNRYAFNCQDCWQELKKQLFQKVSEMSESHIDGKSALAVWSLC